MCVKNSMGAIEKTNLIDINLFDTCKIDGKSKEDIIKIFPTRKGGAYYLDKFSNHLSSLGFSIKEYCKVYLNVNWPRCPISNEEVGYNITGKGIIFSKFKKGKISKEHSEAFKASCEKFSKERMGEGNPMYNKIPWNKNLSKDDEYRTRMRKLRIGKFTPKSVRDKQADSAKRRKIHGHLGFKHSNETKNILREKTAYGWASGRFSKVTSIHKKVREFLSTLILEESPKEEYLVKYYSMDFAFPEHKVAIECQGTYFHIDPRVYKDGPINAMQRRNAGRDKAKKTYCENNGWKIIEIWELEINDGRFKEQLKCKLQELNLLNQLENKNV